MQLNLDEVKQNCFQLVQHLPARYELAFVASLVEELYLHHETDAIWNLVGQVPDFQVDHSQTASYLKKTGYSDDFCIYLVKNKAATIAALFNRNPDICYSLALYVIKSMSLDAKAKSKLIRALNRRNLPTIRRLH